MEFSVLMLIESELTFFVDEELSKVPFDSVQQESMLLVLQKHPKRSRIGSVHVDLQSERKNV